MMKMDEPFLANSSGPEGDGGEKESSSAEPSASPEKKLLRGGSGGGSGGSPKMSASRKICKRLLPSRLRRRDELHRFQRFLIFLGLDQSSTTRLAFSWICFILFTVVVPLLSWVYVSCDNCDFEHSHPFQYLVDCSESALAAVSFLCLSHILRKYGLKKALLLDKLGNEAMSIRDGYEKDIHNSCKWLVFILLPCLAVEIIHKMWWYVNVSVEVPFFSENPVVNILVCSVTLVAWLYKSSAFLFVCILFRLMCSLQLHRLQAYIKLLEETSDVLIILKEHICIRDQLLMISHRSRIFVILSMFTITFSQLASLFVVTDSRNEINFFRAGDLVVCSIVQLSGFVLCIHGAAKITHAAQRIMGIVSQWHALATCTAPDMSYPSHSFGPAHPLIYNNSYSDLETAINVASRSANSCPLDIEAYQQRQALIGYLQFAHAGISLYGFVLDRGFLLAIFGMEFSLTLFILGKTILTQ